MAAAWLPTRLLQRGGSVLRTAACSYGLRIGQELDAACSGPAVSAQQPAAGSRHFANAPSKPKPKSGKYGGQQAGSGASQQKQQAKGGGKKQQQGQAEARPSADAAAQGAKAAAPERLPPWLTLMPVSWLSADDVNKYYVLGEGDVPEAYRQYYADPLLTAVGIEPRGGCSGLQEEFETTGERLLLHRAATQGVMDTLTKGSRRRLLLDGPTGSGKSIALLQLVAWARDNGWVAMYVPSAGALVDGGFYERREDGSVDAPDTPRKLLQSLHDAHGELLKSLTSESGKRVAAAVERGLAAGEGAEVVDAFLEALEGLTRLEEQQVRTLVAVDDYNRLFGPTGYYESTPGSHRRDNISPDRLRAASAMRLMHRGGALAPNAAVVAALSGTCGVSPRLAVPRGSGAEKSWKVEIPRFSAEELAVTAAYYAALGMVGEAPADPRDSDFVTAHALVGGSPREFRKYCTVLT